MEDNIKNIGYIYKITNKINGKIYIGQTTQTIESRWGDHKKSSKNKDKMKYPLYRAMNKYGIENFIIEEVEKCEINKLNKLNEKEIYWISFYDSFNSDKGYNLTLGGGGTKFYNLDESLVLKQFEELDNVSEVAKIYGCASNVIKEILDKHNIHVKNSTERGFSVDRYSLDGILLEHYESLHEASMWIKEHCEEANNRDASNISFCLKRKVCLETSYYNFYWKSEDITSEIINKTISKSRLLQKNIRQKNKDICPICNKNLKTKESNMCSFCRNNQLSTKIRENKKNKYLEELNNKIPKETLMELVYYKSFNEIGRMYSVGGNAIKKWCKHYCIPFRREDIKEIKKEDWEKECNLSKEEYESKYINTKKEKPIITDQEIINKYLETKSLSKVSNFYKKDRKTIKAILIKNNIELENSILLNTKKTSNVKLNINKNKILKVQQLDNNSLEILNEYSNINEVVDYIYDNNLVKFNCPSSLIRKNLYDSNINNKEAYGYRWKFIYE